MHIKKDSPNICSRMQSGTTFHQQQNLLTLPGLRDSTTIHQLEYICLQIIHTITNTRHNITLLSFQHIRKLNIQNK